MKQQIMVSVICFIVGWGILTSQTLASPSLLMEPPESHRVDEIYDQESQMILFVYSIRGDGKVDYVSGRSVIQHMRSKYGNPVYYFLEHPLLYWWNHTMWNDPSMDGVNGNEMVYQENIDFDISRYKPCVFNGQAC